MAVSLMAGGYPLGAIVGGVIVSVLLASPVTAQYTLYYGNFHSHTTFSADAQGGNSGPPDVAFTYARDTAGIDILSVTDHSHYLTASEYSQLLSEGNNFTQNGVFVALAGQEHGSLSTSVPGAFGHVNIWEFSGVLNQSVFRYDLPATYNLIGTSNDRFTWI